MASVNRIVLASGALSGTSATSTVQLEMLATDIIAVCVCSVLGANTFYTYLEHSPDGTEWYTLGQLEKPAGGHLSAAGTQIYRLPNTSGILGAVRIRYALAGGTTNATATLELRYDKRR